MGNRNWIPSNPNVETDSFVKHDGKKGCSPSLIPTAFRRGLRTRSKTRRWRPSSTNDIYSFVEGYEEEGTHDSLLDAGFELAQLENDSLVEFLWEVAQVMDIGAIKYSRDNWMKCPYEERYRYLDAFYRHTYAYEMGELLDPESGKSHLAHAGCCLAMLHGLIDIHQGTDKQESIVITEKSYGTVETQPVEEFKASDTKPGHKVSKALDKVYGKGNLAERDRVVGALNDIQSPKSGGLT